MTRTAHIAPPSGISSSQCTSSPSLTTGVVKRRFRRPTTVQGRRGMALVADCWRRLQTWKWRGDGRRTGHGEGGLRIEVDKNRPGFALLHAPRMGEAGNHRRSVLRSSRNAGSLHVLRPTLRARFMNVAALGRPFCSLIACLKADFGSGGLALSTGHSWCLCSQPRSSSIPSFHPRIVPTCGDVDHTQISSSGSITIAFDLFSHPLQRRSSSTASWMCCRSAPSSPLPALSNTTRAWWWSLA